MFQRFDITNTNAAPKTTSNPTTVQVLIEKSHYRDDRNSAIATAETRILKQRRIKNPVNAVQIAAPAARVALTGSIVSLLPLGSYTAMFSILAMSIVSRRLQSQAVGCVVAFLHAGGLSGLEGQVLALLSFISFSAVLGKSKRLHNTPNCVLTNNNRQPGRSTACNIQEFHSRYRTSSGHTHCYMCVHVL